MLASAAVLGRLQVGTTLQQLPETAAAVQKAGIPRKRVPAVLYKHPAILSRQPEEVLSTCRQAATAAMTLALMPCGIAACISALPRQTSSTRQSGPRRAR